MAEGQHSRVDISFDEDCCVICKLGFQNEKATTVSEKGITSLISFSEERGWSELHAHLTEAVNKTPIGKVLVHKHCRRDFTNRRRATCFRVLDDVQLPQAKRLRSSVLLFNWKENCMLCVKSAEIDARHPERNKVHRVTTLAMTSCLNAVAKGKMHGHLRFKIVFMVVLTW